MMMMGRGISLGNSGRSIGQMVIQTKRNNKVALLKIATRIATFYSFMCSTTHPPQHLFRHPYLFQTFQVVVDDLDKCLFVDYFCHIIFVASVPEQFSH